MVLFFGVVCKTVFGKFDEYGDGRVPINCIKQALQLLDQSPTEANINDVISTIPDGAGKARASVSKPSKNPMIIFRNALVFF